MLSGGLGDEECVHTYLLGIFNAGQELLYRRLKSMRDDPPVYIYYDNGTCAYTSSNGFLVCRLNNERSISIEVVKDLL